MEYSDGSEIGNEYEAQFFGFTPKSFVDGVYNAVNDYVSDCLEELTNLLKEETTLSDGCSLEQIYEATEAAGKNFHKSVDSSFDRFEKYVMNNIFKIPPHVLLPEDKIHQGHRYTEEEEREIDLELQDLQRKIKAAKYVNTSLKQELKEQEMAEGQIKIYEDHLTEIEAMCTGAGGLKECVAFSCDQANKLHSLVSSSLEDGTLPLKGS